MGNKNEGYLGGIMGGGSRVESGGGGLKSTGILSLEEAGTQTVDVVSVPDVSDLSLTDGLTLVSGTKVDHTAASNSYEDAYITLPTGSGYVYAEVHMYAADESNIHQAVGLINPTYIDTGANGQTNDKAYTVKRVGTSWFRMTGSHNTVTQTIMGRAATNTYHFLADLDTGNVWLGITPEGSTLRWIRNDNTMNATWSSSDPTFSALDLTTYGTFYFQQYYTTQSAWVNFGGNPLFDGQLSSGNDSSDWFKDPDASVSASSFTLGPAETLTLPQLSWGGITGRSVLTEGSAAVPGDDNWNDVSLLISGSGVTAGSSVTDLSTAGNNHTSVSTSSLSTTGPYGASQDVLDFDGTNDWLHETTASGDFKFGTDDFTIEFWAKSDISTSDYVGLIDYDKSANTTQDDYFVVHLNGNEYSLWTGDGNILAANTTATNWNHIAITRQGTSAEMFINGVSVDTTAASGTSLPATMTSSTSRKLYIGRQWWSTNLTFRCFNGKMADIRITRGVARDIAADWAAGLYDDPPLQNLPVAGTPDTLVNTGIFTLEEIYELTKSN